MYSCAVFTMYQCIYVFMRGIYSVLVQENLTDSYAVFTMYRCNRNLYVQARYLRCMQERAGTFMYKVSVQENLTDSHAVFYLQCVGAELTRVFGHFIYRISVQS